MKDLNDHSPSKEGATESGSSADQTARSAKDVIDIGQAREAGAEINIVTRKVGRGKNARTVGETTTHIPKRQDGWEWLEPYKEMAKKNREAAELIEAQKAEEASRIMPKMISEEDKQRKAEARDRRAAESRVNSRPLALLVRKEAELREQSAALTTIPKLATCPDPDLLVSQLTAAVNAPSVSGGHKAKKMKEDTLRLYAALESRDAIESIIHRVIVGVGSATMNCIARANSTEKVPAREVNLRYATKGADTLCNLVKLRDARRGGGQQSVTVGKLKVERGGQAIVGHVNAARNRTESETDGQTS